MYKYQDFLLEKEIEKNYFELFKSLSLTLNESEFLDLLEVKDFYQLNEDSIVFKLKDKMETIKNTIKEKGKSALSDAQERILKIGGKIKTIISEIINKAKKWISEFIKTQFSSAKSIVSKYSQDLSLKVSNIKDKKKLISEANHIKQMSKAFLSWISSGFFKNFENAAVKAASQDLNESLELLESENSVIPYSHKIVSLLNKIPPFSEIASIEHEASKFSSIALNKTSYKISKLTKAIEAMEFHVIPSLIGIVVGYKIEHLAKDAILEMIPGIGTICSILSTIALSIAIIEIIEITNTDTE